MTILQRLKFANKPKAIPLEKSKQKEQKKGIGKLIERIKQRFHPQNSFMKNYLDLAGIEKEYTTVSKQVFNLVIFLNLAISGYLLYLFSTQGGKPLAFVFIVMAVVWTGIFCTLLFISWLLFYLFIDIKIFQRQQSVEEVLPEFLQLTAANMRAGMTIDRAMLFAMRPKFGIFATEIEHIAKATYTGEEFQNALLIFAQKYKSAVLSRSISLIIEGMNAGGEIAGLLTKIAEDIQDVRLLKKDMSASVATYIIFITVASVIAAPVLFALSTQLIGVITSLSGSLGQAASSPSTMGIGISFSQVAIKESDFQIFSIAMLTVTCGFAAAIVATIKKGSVKAGITYLPTYVGIAIVLYFILNLFLNGIFGGLVIN